MRVDILETMAILKLEPDEWYELGDGSVVVEITDAEEAGRLATQLGFAAQDLHMQEER